jgi:mevalonate kinase
MRWEKFRTRVPGKWVLAGEHAVLRGATAVALPHAEFGLDLSFDPEGSREGFAVEPESASGLIDELVRSVAESWEQDGRSFSMPRGKLQIDSSIPIGAGLGSSAALCVALSQWMSDPLLIQDRDLTAFATQLEHRFHGRSSGMDVAVISSSEPISFVMNRGPRSIGVKKLPRFTFHDTGLRSRTSECVIKVEKFREESPMLAMKIDDSMGEASRLAMEGLILYDAGDVEKGLTLLRRSMKQAQECFYSWELVPGDAKRLEERLLGQGALGVKLTGAGGGGMIVALWS